MNGSFWLILDLGSIASGNAGQTTKSAERLLCQVAGGLCLVLYASFEASEDDRPF